MRVLVTEPIHENGLILLRRHFTVIEANTRDEQALCELVGDCAGLLVRTAGISARVIAAGTALRCIAKHGVGVDNIDLEAATNRGIRVVNAPFSNCNAVAEHALGFMLALLRRTASADKAVREGTYAALRAGLSLGELTGKTVGLVGFGRIPQRLTELLGPFRVSILAYDPYASDQVFLDAGVRRCASLRELLERSDIVSVHVPLSDASRHLLNRDSLACLKPGAFLVDTARGGIVDEAAVVEALEHGTLAGAAFDVFEQEPPAADNPLLTCEKTLLSPHSAALTAEALENMAVQAAENLVAVLQGKEPSSCVNRAALALLGV